MPTLKNLKLSFPFGQSPFVEGIAFYQIFSQNIVCPDTELGTPPGVDPVADGENDVQVVVQDVSRYRSFAFASNLCKFCTSCVS